MRQETLTNNPRIEMVAETVLAPLIERLLPQIVEAQKQNLLPVVDPILSHYMMVSLTATLSEFGPEMRLTSGLSSEDPKVAAAYWRPVEETASGKEVSPTFPPAARATVKLPPDRAQAEPRLVPDNTACDRYTVARLVASKGGDVWRENWQAKSPP